MMSGAPFLACFLREKWGFRIPDKDFVQYLKPDFLEELSEIFGCIVLCVLCKEWDSTTVNPLVLDSFKQWSKVKVPTLSQKSREGWGTRQSA